MFMELMNFFASTYVDVFGITAGPPLHDPLAVAAVLDGVVGVQIPFYDSLSADGKKGEVERFSVKVVTEGTHEEAMNGITQTGRTIVKLLDAGKEGIRIPRNLNVSRFWTLLEESMHLADLKNAENLELKTGTTQ
jgi:uridine nucleosidase